MSSLFQNIFYVGFSRGTGIRQGWKVITLGVKLWAFPVTVCELCIPIVFYRQTARKSAWKEPLGTAKSLIPQ